MWGFPSGTLELQVSGLNSDALRTIDVARESGYSVQQIRDLERVGVIPSAERTPTGYRLYAPLHVTAVRAYRELASAAGPVMARRLLSQLQIGVFEAAIAAVTTMWVDLAQERDSVLRAQKALHTIGAEAAGLEGEAADDSMSISELASALGVPPSTLRHWDSEGLAVPERVTSLRARRYGVAAIRQARIVATLRGSAYGVAAIRDIMDALLQLDGIPDVELILHQRLEKIDAKTISLLRAGTGLAAVIEARAVPKLQNRTSNEE